MKQSRPLRENRPEYEEPYRRWLHALEGDDTVPYYALQVARVFADYAATTAKKAAAGSGGEWDGLVHVNWEMLVRHTHQRNDRLSQSLDFLTRQAWLIPEPRKNGQRQFYSLADGASAVIPSNGSHP